MKRAFNMFSIFSWLLPLSALMVWSDASPRAAADETIMIELNKIEDSEEGCRPLFLFDNQSGRQLNAFQVALVLFDDKGVYLRQILLDMAPFYQDKKVVASFLTSGLACDEIGSMLINALPRCADEAGVDLDCIAMLEVTSKTAIALEK